MGGLKRALFLDRDGTLNVKAPAHEYITSSDAFEWLPGAPEALARLAQAGFVLTVVSNQRGVSRGLVSLETLRGIEDRIQHDLEPHNCAITAFRYCTHASDTCDCRKPKPGMILELAKTLGLDIPSSWMVGDDESDIQAGEAAGCSTALLGAAIPQISATVHASTLSAVTDLILARRAQVEATWAANSATSSSYVRSKPS